MKPILHVDGDPRAVFLLQEALKKAGVPNPVYVASDGQQAIAYWQGSGKFADRRKFPMPCLVLMELRLQHVTGLEVLRSIRQDSLTPLVVIILTSSGDNRNIATAYKLGANAFLTKPSEATKLDEMAKAIKDFWLTHNNPPGSSPESPMEGVVSLVRSSGDQARSEP